MPKLSVIIPVYRSYPRMVELLDSILAQTFNDFELILINDCTPDKESREYCDVIATKDSRIRLFHLDKNRGIAGARNFGLEQVTGEFIHFSDADDYVAPTMYDDCIKELERSGADILITPNIVRYVKNDKDCILEIPVDQKAYIVKDAFPFLYENNFINLHPIWNKMYRTNIIKANNIQFRYDVDYADDFCFNIDCIYHTQKISFLSKPYYYWYNWSKTQFSSRILTVDAIKNVIIEYYKLFLHYDWYCDKQEVFNDIVYLFFINGLLHKNSPNTFYKISVCKKLVKQYNIIGLSNITLSRINKLVLYLIEKQYQTWIIAIFYYIKLFQERKI